MSEIEGGEILKPSVENRENGYQLSLDLDQLSLNLAALKHRAAWLSEHYLALSLSLSLARAHTHTHTHGAFGAQPSARLGEFTKKREIGY